MMNAPAIARLDPLGSFASSQQKCHDGRSVGSGVGFQTCLLNDHLLLVSVLMLLIAFWSDASWDEDEIPFRPSDEKIALLPDCVGNRQHMSRRVFA